jgi:tRNA1Val (adenine37-N6)-methyltransferase
MMAQRSDAEIIDAVEIDADAYIESVSNFENSPWGDRLFCYHTSIQEFAEEIDEKYSLIIANPPYFNPHNIKSVNQKSIARQTHLLNHMSLLKTTKKLLDIKGHCAFIIPFEIESFFIELANSLGLIIQKITRTKDNKTATYSRSMLRFGFKKVNLEIDTIILKNEDKTYSKEFVNLSKDFYIDF